MTTMDVIGKNSFNVASYHWRMPSARCVYIEMTMYPYVLIAALYV